MAEELTGKPTGKPKVLWLLLAPHSTNESPTAQEHNSISSGMKWLSASSARKCLQATYHLAKNILPVSLRNHSRRRNLWVFYPGKPHEYDEAEHGRWKEEVSIEDLMSSSLRAAGRDQVPRTSASRSSRDTRLRLSSRVSSGLASSGHDRVNGAEQIRSTRGRSKSPGGDDPRSKLGRGSATAQTKTDIRSWNQSSDPMGERYKQAHAADQRGSRRSNSEMEELSSHYSGEGGEGPTGAGSDIMAKKHAPEKQPHATPETREDPGGKPCTNPKLRRHSTMTGYVLLEKPRLPSTAPVVGHKLSGSFQEFRRQSTALVGSRPIDTPSTSSGARDRRPSSASTGYLQADMPDVRRPSTSSHLVHISNRRPCNGSFKVEVPLGRLPDMIGDEV